MKHLRRTGVSAGVGLIATLLSIVFYRQGGELLAIPGILIEGWIDLAFYLRARSDEFPHILDWQYCTFGFYFLTSYGLSWAVTGIMAERQREHRGAKSNKSLDASRDSVFRMKLL
jgi:hypothetical protein